MSDNRKDVPKPSDVRDEATKKVLTRFGEELSKLMGFRGDKLDRALTPRDLLSDAFRQGYNIGVPAPGAGGVTGPPGAPGGVIAEPDLTPPPTPEGLAVTAGLTVMYIEWDAALYTQGHGHAQTNIYVAKKAVDDPVNPTFADAVHYSTATGALTLFAMPSELSTRWHIWIKWQSVDGVESAAPAGGTNGVSAQTGKIGETDLGPLLIEAGELATQDFSNLVTNPDGRFGNSGWAAGVPPVAANDPVTIPFWGGPYLYFVDRDSRYGRGFKVEAGEQYRVKAQMLPQGGLTSPYACGIGLFFYATLAAVEGDAPVSWALGASAVGTVSGLRNLEGVVTIPAGVLYARPWIWIDGPHGGISPNGFFTGAIDVRRRTDETLIVNGAIKAQHLAANSIAVGTAAIQNGAIVNAMLGNATIDSAKIANLNAVHLTAGDGTVGGPLKSANYVFGSAGWLLRAADGYFEASNAVLRGGVYASYGAIGQLQIGSTYIQSSNYVGGVQGYRFNSDGTGQIGGLLISANSFTSSNWTGPGGTGFGINYLGDAFFNNLYARGDIQATSLSAATGTFTGSLVAATGTFSGTLTSAAINAVNTINLAGLSVTIMKGESITGWGALFFDLAVTSADLPPGSSTVPVIVTGTMAMGSSVFINIGVDMPNYFTTGNLFYGTPAGGVWSVTTIHDAPVGTHRYSVYHNGIGDAANAAVIYLGLTAILGKR